MTQLCGHSIISRASTAVLLPMPGWALARVGVHSAEPEHEQNSVFYCSAAAFTAAEFSLHQRASAFCVRSAREVLAVLAMVLA